MTDSSDIYLNELKRGGRKGGKINLSKAQVEASKIVQSLPISSASKEILLKLIKKHQLLSIDKIGKISNKSATLNGKFISEGTAQDVIIKVCKGKMITNDVRIVNNNRGEKSIFLYQEGNVSVIEILKGSKTLEEMMKENPSKIEQYCREVLKMCNAARFNLIFSRFPLIAKKKVIFYNKTWFIVTFVDTIAESSYFNYNWYDHTKVHTVPNLIQILEIFRSNRMLKDQIWRIFDEIFVINRWAGGSGCLKTVRHNYFVCEKFDFRENYSWDYFKQKKSCNQTKKTSKV